MFLCFLFAFFGFGFVPSRALLALRCSDRPPLGSMPTAPPRVKSTPPLGKNHCCGSAACLPGLHAPLHLWPPVVATDTCSSKVPALPPRDPGPALSSWNHHTPFCVYSLTPDMPQTSVCIGALDFFLKLSSPCLSLLPPCFMAVRHRDRISGAKANLVILSTCHCPLRR